MSTKLNRCPVCFENCSQRFVECKWEYSIYECSNCSVQYSIPFESNPQDARIKMGYRRRLELIGNYIGWFHHEFLKMNFNKKVNLLEIGCGTGDFVNLACEKGYKAVGVDLDKEAVLRGREYWKTQALFPMTAAEYFSKNGGKQFDNICFFEVIEHLSDPHAFFKEIKRYLSSEGYIIFSAPNNGSVLQKIYRKITRIIDYPPQHLIRWNKKSIEIFLALHGCEIVLRKTCEPTITDIIPDIYKLYSPAIISSKFVMNFNNNIN